MNIAPRTRNANNGIRICARPFLTLRSLREIVLLSPLLLLSACNSSDTLMLDVPAPPTTAVRCAHFDAQRQPFFGDLHVHTKYSLDASTQGTIINPHEAYRYALGERLGVQPYSEAGEPLRFTQLARPLDFAAVTDHAELFGETEICTNPELDGYDSLECRFFRAAPAQAFIVFNFFGPGLIGLPGLDGEQVPRLPFCGLDGARCLEAAKTPWRDIQQAAAAFNDSSSECGFTAFVGYEFTASPLSNNLHRNVIFESEVVPEIPPAYQDYPSPELLWQALDEQCRAEDGCRVLTIPHNSNLSGGLMFQAPEDPVQAQRRQQYEPLVEIYQHKGDSECLNTTGAGMQDELCGFEKLPYRNFTGSQVSAEVSGPPLEQDFVRDALKQGLLLEQNLGANPFKYGLIGSSDTHLGTPGKVAEIDYLGHGGAGGGARDEVPAGLPDLIENSPGGLAVLWAEENTRSALFAAMQRREAYATSGTRPVVRFFGGADLPADLCDRRDFAAQGYARGVAMGGDLPAVPTGARPRFAVSALRDPGLGIDTAQPLQRIQIVKGWIADGEPQERVYEIAGDANNGASVDLSTCETSGSGFASLCAVWEDPEFEATQSAFWYARVVENPSCRWSTRQCLAAGIDCAAAEGPPEGFEGCCDAAYPRTIQERAWTSPIWYRPGG